MNEQLYVLLNDEDVPIGKGVLITAPDAEELRVKVFDDAIDDIEEHKLVTLVGMLQTMPTLRGEVLRCTRDVAILRRVEAKADVRAMLRVNVSFETLIYPVDDSWSGRYKVESLDLSCGGIAFFCEKQMERGDRFEIVIPITPNPLLLRCEVLRTHEKEGRTCYAAKFLDMCHDEEKFICEAVFGVQLNQHMNRQGKRG